MGFQELSMDNACRGEVGEKKRNGMKVYERVWRQGDMMK
jgi:hypothetical protein